MEWVICSEDMLMLHQKASAVRHGGEGATRARARDVTGRLRLKRGVRLSGRLRNGTALTSIAGAT